MEQLQINAESYIMVYLMFAGSQLGQCNCATNPIKGHRGLSVDVTGYKLSVIGICDKTIKPNVVIGINNLQKYLTPMVYNVKKLPKKRQLFNVIHTLSYEVTHNNRLYCILEGGPLILLDLLYFFFSVTNFIAANNRRGGPHKLRVLLSFYFAQCQTLLP